MVFQIIVLAMALSSCATIQDGIENFLRSERLKPNPKLFYRYDMKLSVNGYQGEGVLVSPRSTSYAMEIEAKQKLDLFTIRSCHREIPLEGVNNERQGGLFGIFGAKRKNVKITFTPNEKEMLDCPLELAGYSKDTGKHSFAFIDFEQPGDALPAMVSCNGGRSNYTGISVCQSREGLLQEIAFPVEVWVIPDQNCPLGEITDKTKGKVFEFALVKGLCTYVFKEVDGQKRTHRMTAIGYEDILVRGDET